MSNTNRLATDLHISKRGNAVGFTAAGETVTGQYRAKVKAWTISVSSVEGFAHLTDERNRNFAELADAKAYAQTLIDAAKTQELAWWS